MLAVRLQWTASARQVRCPRLRAIRKAGQAARHLLSGGKVAVFAEPHERVANCRLDRIPGVTQ
ncbi:MAG TPA: hypothetical protein VFL31_02840, partial [Nitrospiraceae bacterium]|nr:hypothetical protein [Nitrospiraceae bacterium]